MFNPYISRTKDESSEIKTRIIASRQIQGWINIRPMALHFHCQLARGKEEQLLRNKLSKCNKSGVEWTHRVKFGHEDYR